MWSGICSPSGVRSGSSPLCGRAQGRFETADAEPCERAFDPVADGRIRVRSPTRLSRSRRGRLASSSSRLGIADMLKCSRSPRSQPRRARFSSAVSSRSVFARRCSRDTAMLFGWVRGQLLCRLPLDPRDNGGDGLLTASELTGARLRKYITAQAHVRSIRQAGIAVILKFALRASVCNFVTEPSIPPNHVRGLDPR